MAENEIRIIDSDGTVLAHQTVEGVKLPRVVGYSYNGKYYIQHDDGHFEEFFFDRRA